MLIGIVGKPNVGKSTFFKALTLMDVAIENYPFTTIKPNRGVGYVRVKCVEDDFKTKCNPRLGYCINGLRFVPVELLDVAGLVPGAHEGKGMGNQFLDDLRQADAFIHVVDASGGTNERGEVVAPGSYDPVNDVKFLEEELDYWVLGILQKNWARIARTIEQTKKELYKEVAAQLSGLNVNEEDVRRSLEGFDVLNPTRWTVEDLLKFSSIIRKISKKMIIAANKIDKSTGKANVERLKKAFPDYSIVGCSAEVELALKEAHNKGLINYVPGSSNFEIVKTDLTDKQKLGLDFMKKFLDEYKTTGVQDILDYAVFKLLEFIAVFPGGLKGLKDSQGRTLPDCFLLPKGSTALDFAYKIHTEIGDKFVKAINVKTKQVLGKSYPLRTRDVIEIMTS